MSETLRVYGIGFTGAFIIISYFAAIILAFVWLRAREAAGQPADNFHKFKSSCVARNARTVEGVGCRGLAAEATDPKLLEPVDLGICVGGFLSQEAFDALEFRSVEIDVENDGRFPHVASTSAGQTVITVDPTRWRK